MSADEVTEMFEQLTELVEVNPNNNLTFCHMGGMPSLLNLIVTPTQEECLRKLGCRFFTQMTNNNTKVQTWAAKVGAVNLAASFAVETSSSMKVALLECLSSFLKSCNFLGKRQYITKLEGLNQISYQFTNLDKLSIEIKDQAKIKTKLLVLLADLVLNDDSIVGDGFYVRDTVSRDKSIIEFLYGTIEKSQLDKP